MNKEKTAELREKTAINKKSRKRWKNRARVIN